MLGIKIAITGIIVTVMAFAVINMIGREPPNRWLSVPLVVLFCGGLIAFLGGMLFAVWS